MENKEEKRCIICNKPYEYHYNMFGRTCLSNLYTQLNISNSRLISNKENYLCNTIASRNFKFFLGKDKKYALTKNYIALDYLKKMNLKSTNNIKNKLEENIKNISVFKKYSKSIQPEYSLNDFYKIYNDYIEFKKLLEKNISSDGKNIDETILKGFSVIFDADKITMPLYYSAFYGMQEIFWKTVVIGGVLANMKLSSYLMNISLNNSGEYDKDENVLTIDDKKVTEILFENSEFRKNLNETLKENNLNIKNYKVIFEENDLLLALHAVTMNIQGIKSEENLWNLEIEIMDKYDFTDIKDLKDYVLATDSIPKSLFSSTLNNMAAISSSYNVIKPFNFTIKTKVQNYDLEKGTYEVV